MAQNTSPIFGLTPNTGFATIASGASGNNATNGTGTVTTIFTAGSNGSFVQKILIRWTSNTTGVGNAIEIIRVYLNNGSTNTTASNNSYIDEVQINPYIPTNTTSGNGVEIPIYKSIPASWNINVANVFTCSGCAFAFTTLGCNY